MYNIQNLEIHGLVKQYFDYLLEIIYFTISRMIIVGDPSIFFLSQFVNKKRSRRSRIAFSWIIFVSKMLPFKMTHTYTERETREIVKNINNASRIVLQQVHPLCYYYLLIAICISISFWRWICWNMNERYFVFETKRFMNELLLAGVDLENVNYGLWHTKILPNCSKSIKIVKVLVIFLILLQIWLRSKSFLNPLLVGFYIFVEISLFAL